jgi:Cu/Ag efflux protein CusF
MNTTRAKFSMVVWASILTTAAFNASATQTAPNAGPEKDYTGTVTAVDLKENTLETKGFLFGKKFNLGSACLYSFIGDTNGAETGLHAGQKVTVAYQDVDGVLVADRIEQQPMRFEGRVKSIDPTAGTVTVHEDGLGMDKEFQFAAGCKVMLRDNRSGVVNDIQPGNYVALVYETPPGMPTIQIISQTSEKFTGTLTAIDLDERTIKAKSLFSEMKFSLGDSCVIVANGKTNGQMSDLKPDDKMVFTFDEINGVNVVNRIAPANDNENTVAETRSGAGD